MATKKIAFTLLISCLCVCASASAQTPFTPPPILPGGQVVPLYPPGSPFLNAARIAEPEQNNMAKGVPGRIQSIVNVHNPSIEFHPADPSNNTGAAMIVIPGGGHNSLVVGTEGADVVHYLFNYGINSIILRNRLRRDGYNAQTDAVYDAQQAIRLVRSRAAEWGIDPKKIGVIGFSAGAELAAPAAIFFEQFEKANSGAGDPLAGVSARPDYAILIYPGPTPFTRDPATVIPKNTPPTFIATAGTGDQNHAVWAMQYFSAMLNARIPNIEMHVYGNGIHANGLKYRDGQPFGTWQDRFVDWFRDLGFLGKPGIETKAAKDVEAHVIAPPPPARGAGRGGRGAGAGAPGAPAPAPATPPTK
jgi:dienelactone hydrolase